MSQDTRKDKRAKVVSLNVRYKSATVDEFIENHSHDVSKGGIFVKTPTPFPPGTLLKFEIRLAGDKSVISGVGRVVWKREPTSAGAEKPAGMGVKFIKIDDASRALIERLTKQEGAGAAYTSDPAAAEDAAASGKPTTLRGIPAAAPMGSVPPAVSSPSNVPAPSTSTAPSAAPAKKAQATIVGVAPPGLAAAAAKAAVSAKPPASASSEPKTAPPPPSRPGAAKAPASEPKKTAVPAPRPQMPPPRRATMMGIGIPSASSPPQKAAAPTTPPPAGAETPVGEKPTLAPGAAAGAMFPSFDHDSGKGPVNEPTVMKQAAELLEEALKEAGGSLDEIGQNPLFLQKGEKEPISVQKVDQSGDTVIMGTGVGATATDATSAALGGTPAPAPAIGGSQPPPAVADSFVPPPAATTGATKRLSDQIEPKKKSGAGLTVFLLLLVVGLAAGGVWAYQSGKLAGLGFGPQPTPPPEPTAEPSAEPTASAPAFAAVDASLETTDASAASAVDAAVLAATGDAAATDVAAKDAGKAATATPTAEAKPEPTVAPAPVYKPKPRPKPAAPTATATDTSETPTTPTATATAVPTSTETPVPTPAPTPKKYEDPYD